VLATWIIALASWEYGDGSWAGGYWHILLEAGGEVRDLWVLQISRCGWLMLNATLLVPCSLLASRFNAAGILREHPTGITAALDRHCLKTGRIPRCTPLLVIHLDLDATCSSASHFALASRIRLEMSYISDDRLC
jgi:hypothetical protein